MASLSHVFLYNFSQLFLGLLLYNCDERGLRIKSGGSMSLLDGNVLAPLGNPVLLFRTDFTTLSSSLQHNGIQGPANADF